MNTNSRRTNRWIVDVVLIAALALMVLPLILFGARADDLPMWMPWAGNIWLTGLAAGLWTMLVGGLAMLVVWLLGGD